MGTQICNKLVHNLLQIYDGKFGIKIVKDFDIFMTANCAVIVCTLNVPGNNKLHGHWCFEMCRVSNKLLETPQIAKHCDHGICDTFPK